MIFKLICQTQQQNGALVECRKPLQRSVLVKKCCGGGLLAKGFKFLAKLITEVFVPTKF